jgi:hypothetical protein
LSSQFGEKGERDGTRNGEHYKTELEIIDYSAICCLSGRQRKGCGRGTSDKKKSEAREQAGQPCDVLYGIRLLRVLARWGAPAYPSHNSRGILVLFAVYSGYENHWSFYLSDDLQAWSAESSRQMFMIRS